MSAIAGGKTLKKTVTVDKSGVPSAVAQQATKPVVAPTAEGAADGGEQPPPSASESEYGPPFNKKPPAGMDMFAEFAWKKRQKEAKAAFAAGVPFKDNTSGENRDGGAATPPTTTDADDGSGTGEGTKQTQRRRLVVGGKEIEFAHARFGATKAHITGSDVQVRIRSVDILLILTPPALVGSGVCGMARYRSVSLCACDSSYPYGCHGLQAVCVEPILCNHFLSNVGEINGNIAVIERGGCSFADKATRAQNAGAIACLFVNTDEELFTLGGACIDISRTRYTCLASPTYHLS